MNCDKSLDFVYGSNLILPLQHVTYPSSAEVEVTDTVVCGEESRADLVCVVQDHHVHIDEDVVSCVFYVC